MFALLEAIALAVHLQDVYKVDELVQQRQIMPRIEDQFLTAVTSRVPCDHVAPVRDHHLLHVALHQYFAVSVLGRH